MRETSIAGCCLNAAAVAVVVLASADAGVLLPMAVTRESVSFMMKPLLLADLFPEKASSSSTSFLSSKSSGDDDSASLLVMMSLACASPPVVGVWRLVSGGSEAQGEG